MAKNKCEATLTLTLTFDLRPQNSVQFILESKWTLELNLRKKFKAFRGGDKYENSTGTDERTERSLKLYE